MNTNLFASAPLAAILSLLALNFANTPASAFTMTFDEFGNCSSDIGTCTSFINPTDLTSTVSAKAPGPVLVFNLPQNTYSGNENILDSTGAISDHLRWIDPSGSDLICPRSSGNTCATMMIYYSLDTGTAPADVGFVPFSTTIPNPVPEDANGRFTFTSTSGNVLNGISDVPLPAALPLFASGLAGLGLLGWRRKKAAA